MRKRILLCIAFLVLVPFGALAEGFRCRTGRLVSLGDRLYNVRMRCGEPDFTDHRIEMRKVSRKVRGKGGSYTDQVEGSVMVEVTIDEWTYDLGSNRLVRYLTFENGRLVDVTTGARGE